MLCNREKILNTVYYGQGRIISGPFFCNSPYYDKSIQPLPFSHELAKQKLAEAGWRDSDGDGILDRNGKKFVFTALQVSGNALQERILAIFKEDLAKVGIDMKIVPLEWPVYIDKLEKRQFEVCSLGWSLPYESDPYQVWHSSQISGNGSNHIGFANAEADRLIEDIRKTLDTEKRIQLCHKLHKLLHEEQPYTFLLVPESLNVFSGKLQNLRVFPLGVDLESVWLKQY
jgi:peptide/nickel transport system substrate-binding protein